MGFRLQLKAETVLNMSFLPARVEEQKLDSKAYLQKVKVEHVEEKSTSDIQVEIVDEIYN